jgi:hypothetical protein
MQLIIYIILLLLPFQTYSEGLPLSITDGGRPSIVNGCVSVITGDYIESSTDLILKGPVNLTFERFYTSRSKSDNSLYDGWCHNHNTKLDSGLDYDTYLKYVKYYNKEGRCATYLEKKGSNPYIFKYQEKGDNGFSNISKGTLSGRSHVKNSFITKVNKDFIVKSENGSVLEFFAKKKDGDKKYFLANESLSSGNILRYVYGKGDNLSGVRAMNSSSSIWYSWIHLENLSRKELKKNILNSKVHASDGSHVNYKLKEFKVVYGPSKYCIEQVQRLNAPSIAYEYSSNYTGGNVQLSKKILPDSRFIKIDYFRDKSTPVFKRDRVKNYILQRV